LDDPAFVKKAFQGATAVLAMIPPNYQAKDFRAWQHKVADAMASAVDANDVRYVLTLSSVGAHLKEGTGPIAGLYDLEQRFNRTGADVLHLRPEYFFENNLGVPDLIRKMGFNGSAMKADLPIPMIASRDVGHYAAKRLLALDFHGKGVKELMGPRDLTMNDVTSIIGKIMGKGDVRYQQLPYEDARRGMMQMGLPEEMAGQYVEMMRGFNEGRVKPTQPRDQKSTAPTTFEEFARKAFASQKKAV
jgi:uncharacterized protein YbjT (DUF2867 family)